jgi:AcrR family transcriptional regulator
MGEVVEFGAAAASPARKILLAFAERAQRGVANVVLAELASDIRMSKRTIYAHFPSKAALVDAMLDYWATRAEAQSAARWSSDETCVQSLRRWADEWANGLGRCAPSLWSELERDYPESYGRYRARMDALRNHSLARMRLWLKPGLSADVALELLFAAVRTGLDPVLCDRHNVTRSDALESVCEIWACGALVDPHARICDVTRIEDAAPASGTPQELGA